MSKRPSCGWAEASLGELVHKLQYGYTAEAKIKDGGVRFVRITDIERGRVVWSKVPGCDITPHDLAKYRLHDGDLVFARTGSLDKAARIAQPPEAVFASYLIRGSPINSKLGLWLEAFVGSQYYVRQAFAESAGIGRPNLNAKKLGQIRLAIPPVKEQARIISALESYLTRLDDAVATLERVQRKLKRYRAAVLKAAVEGRLVPTETELARAEGRQYEPASALLERILVERRRQWEEAEQAKLKARGNVPKDDQVEGTVPCTSRAYSDRSSEPA